MAEWKCRHCGAWVSTKDSIHIHLEPDGVMVRTRRREDDPIRETEEAAKPTGPSRWFVVYRRPNSGGLRWGGRFHSIIHSDNQTLLWPHGWDKPLFSRQIPEHAWDIDLFAMIELYETGKLDRSAKFRVAAVASQATP